MENDLSDFMQPRNALDESSSKCVGRVPLSVVTEAFPSTIGRSKEFPSAWLSARRRHRRSLRMDDLVHDLTCALDESTAALSQQTTSSQVAPRKRKVWRRCKSTSNLAAIVAVGGVQVASALSQNNSIDETSTSSGEEAAEEEASFAFEVISGSRGDKGTSSVQLTDSDETCNVVDDGAMLSRRLNPHYSSSVRKKRASTLQKCNGKDSSSCSNVYDSANQVMKLGQGGGMNRVRLSDKPQRPEGLEKARESDSLNENVSKLRSNTKRKRRFKRIALDPEIGNRTSSKGMKRTWETKDVNSLVVTESLPLSKKNKIRPACTLPLLELAKVDSKRCLGQFPENVSPALVKGKRKRSNREKSVETESTRSIATRTGSGSFAFGDPEKKDCCMMDFEEDSNPHHRNRERRPSSSSFSSSESEEDNKVGTQGQHPNLSGSRRDDAAREADDEQSDWPGFDEDAERTMCDISDHDEIGFLDNSLDGGTLNTLALTSTAKQAYLARMKRLADCVPGREIRAGSRRLRSRQRGFAIKSSSSDQVARFLQDPRRTELKLTILRPSDRNKIAHLADLYSLSIRSGGIGNVVDSSNVLVLNKTGRTLKVDDEFLVPQVPPLKPCCPAVTEAKRRRKDGISNESNCMIHSVVELPNALSLEMSTVPDDEDSEKSTPSSDDGDEADQEQM